MNEPIKVAVAGYRGKVGSILAAALAAEPDIDFVGGIARGDDLAAFLHSKRPRAFVDFTRPAEAMHNVLAAVAIGASPVVGTSGLSTADVDKLETACKAKGLGGIVAPNFAIGAVLMMHLAEIAAPHSARPRSSRCTTRPSLTPRPARHRQQAKARPPGGPGSPSA